MSCCTRKINDLSNKSLRFFLHSIALTHRCVLQNDLRCVVRSKEYPNLLLFLIQLGLSFDGEEQEMMDSSFSILFMNLCAREQQV